MKKIILVILNLFSDNAEWEVSYIIAEWDSRQVIMLLNLSYKYVSVILRSMLNYNILPRVHASGLKCMKLKMEEKEEINFNYIVFRKSLLRLKVTF